MQEKEALIEIFDENQNSRGSKKRSEIDKNNDIIKNSNILVFNQQGRLLIISPKDNAWKGKWASSAAGMVRERETFEDCAKRTLKRELGIEPELEFLEEGFYDFGDKKRIIGFFTCRVDSEEIQPNENDSEEHHWKSLEEVNELIQQGSCLPTLKEGIKSIQNKGQVF